MSKIALAGAVSGTATFTIESPATSTNRTITLADATGTMVVSGTTPSLNGITFPATQVASADANTLDDSEEGTWTPAFSFSSSNSGVTFSTQVGTYIKVGRFVWCYFDVIMSAKGSGSGDASLTGLPFTVTNNANARGSCAVSFFSGMTAVNMIVMRCETNSTTATISTTPAAGAGTTDLTAASNFNNTSRIQGVITFSASA